MEGMSLLEKKVDGLLKKHAALHAEIKKLTKALDKKNREGAELLQKLAEAEKLAGATSIAKGLPDKKTRIAARKQIDSVIAGIDKILMNLND